MFTTFSSENPPTGQASSVPVLGAIAVVLARFRRSAAPRSRPYCAGSQDRRHGDHRAPGGTGGALLILVFAIITALGFLGVPQASIFAVVGAASLALALSLQNTLSNVASGIMLAWIRPVAVGEYVKGDGVEGEVVEIGLFGTRLRSTNGIVCLHEQQQAVERRDYQLQPRALAPHRRECHNPRHRASLWCARPCSAWPRKISAMLPEPEPR